MQTVTRGNPTEVKAVLATVALALGAYQLALIAVGYRRLRPSFLGARPATRAHRAVGDAIAALLVLTAFMCLAVFGVAAGLHAAAGAALLAVLAVKVAVVRWIPRAGRLLPPLGLAVFTLLALTWLTSADGVLGDG